ncbi:MAG: luciferase domain-containing protein [Actinomycetota bacterium]
MTEHLRDLIASLDGVAESPSMFRDDLAYWVNGKEIAHFESADLIEIRLTREVIRRRRAQLKGDPRVDLRYSGSDWVSVRLSSPAVRALVMELVEDAANAHRPLPGVTPEPPPTGPDLERRRRFH